MNYDWEEIFKSKTNKELYDIVCGKTTLTSEAITYAKSELENRNFDFENMEANKDAWNLSSLIEEYDYANLEILRSKFNHVSIKRYLLIIAGTAIILLVFNKIQNQDLSFLYNALLISFIIISILVVINNYISKKQKEKQNKRRDRIVALTEKLKKQNQLDYGTPIFNEIKRQSEKKSEGIQVLSQIGFFIAGTMLLILLIKFLIMIFK